METELSLSSIVSPEQTSDLELKRCLCHIRSGSDRLTDGDPQFTNSTWQTFKQAARQRNDSVACVLRFRWEEGPVGGYHKQCYLNYTHRDHIQRLLGKRKEPVCRTDTDTNEADHTATAKRTRSTVQKDKCIFCHEDKVVRTKHGTRKPEKLSLCCTISASAKLKAAATARHDDRLMMQIEDRDLIADRVKYHHSCYKAYTKAMKMEDRTNEGTEYEEAFDILVHDVHRKVLVASKILKMTDVRLRFIHLLGEKGKKAPEYRAEKLKIKLQRHFGETITFHKLQNRGQAEIIFSSALKTGNVVESLLSASEAADTQCNWEFDADEAFHDELPIGCHVYHCAKYLRHLLLNVTQVLSWPPSADDMDTEAALKALIPAPVYNMLAWILCDDAEHDEYNVDTRRPVPSRAHRLILSIAQDLLHCTTHAYIKTPKHVYLPMTLKSLTGSAEVVAILNRLGHSLSYSTIEEAETAMAEEQLSRWDSGAFLPSICQEDTPAIFCWDNNDILEETLSGQGTTHCTNGIAIQRQKLGCTKAPVRREVGQPHVSRNRTLHHVPEGVIPYIPSRRKGPPNVKISVDQLRAPDTSVFQCANIKNFCWFSARLSKNDDDRQTVPAWTAFNVAMHEKTLPRLSLVGYCQTIEASATELPTVYTVLQRSLEMADQLNQHDCIVVFDQAIYAKALEIIWTNTEIFSRIVLRMGAFHMACAFLAVIGKRFGEAGLGDIMIESGIIGSGSIAGVLEGRHYNRAVRMHKIVLEALLRLRWDFFLRWLGDDGDTHTSDLNVLDEAVDKIRQSCTSDNIQALLDEPSLSAVFAKVEMYASVDGGPMKAFWGSYIEMVQVVLHFIRATREGDWDLHLACVRDMLPWFFAYDRINYARYASVYWVQMMLLPKTHPEADQQLRTGELGVQRNVTHGFSQVAVDQTIEQTLNRNTKTKGGIIGFSLKQGAVQRWITTAHSRSAIVDKCRAMTGSGNTQDHCKETTTPRMKKDEEDVCAVKSIISSWMNPFDTCDNLVSIASGVVASETARDHLLNAHDKGRQHLLKFVEERLVNQSVDLFDKITKLKLQTFSTVQTKTQVGGGELMLKADRNLFARLLVVAQSRKMNMKDILGHELGPIPWSLANPSGGLIKTDKSALPKALESDDVQTRDRSTATACIVDAMAIIQSLKRIPGTFATLAEEILDHIISYAGRATRVDFVGDRYPSVTIKQGEHSARACTGQVKIKITHCDQKCPKQWKKFLSVGSNKEALLSFLQRQWSSHTLTGKLKGKCLYVTNGTSCEKISSESEGIMTTQNVPALSCTHEEADTRLLFHAQHAAAEGHSVILIKSSDTDVEILSCHHSWYIPAQLILHSGTQAKSRLIDISALAGNLGRSICEALPGLHAMTGCDTVSAFAGRGKKKALDLLRADQEWCSMLQSLGKNFPPNDGLLSGLEKFVCALYGKPGECVNTLRYDMFRKATNLQSFHLPPTRDALKNHIARANYQTAVWLGALQAQASLPPSPDGHGWKVKDGTISINWMSQQPAPATVLQFVACKCKGDCQNRRCSCHKHGLTCTDCCSCSEICQNTDGQAEEEPLDDDDDD